MNIKQYIIDGRHFSDMEGFYKEINSILNPNNLVPQVNNLDALNDLLRGGFGAHEYGETIAITWKASDKSKIDLGSERFDTICQVIEDADGTDHECMLVLMNQADEEDD